MFDPYAAIRPAYMQRPIERPTAYYFLRTLLIAGGIAGGLVALYRNDVLLELSRHVGQESRYFELEQYLGVTPGWGTPRSMQPVLEGSQPTAEQPAVALAVAASERAVAASTAEAAAVAPAVQPEPATGNVPVAAAIATAAAPSPAAEVPKGRSDDALAPVSLDSLPVLPRGGRAAIAEVAPIAAAAERTAPSRAATSSSKPRAESASLARESDAEPAPRSRKARDVDEAPARTAKAPKAAPAPERPKTEPNPHDNPLTASIRAAVRARPAKE
jgi:hypothetical protein